MIRSKCEIVTKKYLFIIISLIQGFIESIKKFITSNFGAIINTMRSFNDGVEMISKIPYTQQVINTKIFIILPAIQLSWSILNLQISEHHYPVKLLIYMSIIRLIQRDKTHRTDAPNVNILCFTWLYVI